MRAAQQPVEQVRRDADVEESAVFAGQRQDLVAGLRAAEHPVVLRGGDICRQGHEADAELGEDAVQEHEHR